MDLCKNTENNINFLYRSNSEKIKFQYKKFPMHLKNPIFGPLSPFQKIWVSEPSGPLKPSLVSEKKLMGQSQENFWTEGQKDGKTDGQNLINS